MSFAFKKFNFFQHSEVHGHAYPRNATCVAPAPPCIHVGCDNGAVQLLDESFQLLCSFPAHGYRVQEVVWLEVCVGPIIGHACACVCMAALQPTQLMLWYALVLVG